MSRIKEIVCEAEHIPVLIVSAATGITDLLISILENLREEKIPEYMDVLINRHDNLSPFDLRKNSDFLYEIRRLQRILFGISYTGELSDTLHDLVLSFGERLVTYVINDVLADTGKKVTTIYPETCLITNGKAKHASIDLLTSAPLLKKQIEQAISDRKNDVIIIPGFYGVSPSGKINLFGRSGTDYSASAVAYLLNSCHLTIWKDVSGFLSADPAIVNDAKRINSLNYGEASELSHFGAKILHHRAVIPAKLGKIPIRLRNIYHPEDVTIISSDTHIDREKIIKSISFMKGLAILKFYNTYGATEGGLMNKITTVLANMGIDVISVATSQTCISFLVKSDELEGKVASLELSCEDYVDSISVVENVSLIACVGEELAQTPGVAFRVFGAMAKSGVNVDMISAGASSSAIHFTVHQKDLKTAILSLHSALA